MSKIIKEADTFCPSCSHPIEDGRYFISTYCSGCNPQMRVEMIHAALANIVSISAFEQEHPTGLHMAAFSLIEKAARAALEFRPAQMKGREG